MSMGNRTASQGTLSDNTPLWSTTGTYTTGNPHHRLCRCNYSVDSLSGNVTARMCLNGDTVRFGWSGDDRLGYARVVGGDSVSFAYDPGGRLVRRTIGSHVATNLLWDRDDLYAELDSAGTGRVGEYSYYPGEDRLHAFIPWSVSSTMQYAHQDVLGNNRGLTDGGGSYSRTYTYDEFGELTGGYSALLVRRATIG